MEALSSFVEGRLCSPAQDTDVELKYVLPLSPPPYFMQ